ncbi:unnamed protein product [Phytophthora lilii]|uniref:Unnamed protein product n=1 Tax=Phytophthora lilii TaxID=2077276 RepID=A0A9W6XDZ6_9STRA|nr:unnamed protein product [Phytophthora lilii]
MVRDRGLQLEVIGKHDEEIDAKDFKQGDGEDKHGTMSGIDEDMDPMLSNADNDAKRILTDYYTQLQSKDIEIPFRLSPVVETKHGIKNHPTYCFGKPTHFKPLNFMTIDRNKHKQVSGEARKGLMRTIRWMNTFTVLLNGIEDIDRYLKDVQYPFPSTDEEATELVKEMKLNQQRRKNLDANLKILNEVILKSAHDIKRQTDRRKCGPKRVISDPLQSMIRTLAFKQHIDQSEYDKLRIDDKKLFKEILAITHLQHNFHDQLEEPLESLRAEYDKLKGEPELGSDNRSIIKQLKSLSVDMYSNRLISDSECGSYRDNADLNVAELKAIMKELIIKDCPQKTQAAVWATDLDKSIRKVDASTQTQGGRVWAYPPKKKLKL